MKILALQETFHHMTEFAISRFEAVGTELGPELDAVYVRICFALRSVEIEEALANAYALRDLERYLETLPYVLRTEVQSLIARLVATQPVGYRDCEVYR